MIFDVQTDIKDAKKAIQDIGESIPKIERKILSALGSRVKALIKKAYPSFLKKDTGTLLKSLISKISRNGQSVVVFPKAIEGDAHYGFVLAAGTVLKAKNGEYLHFKIGNKWVRVAEVTIKPRSWIRTPADSFLDNSEYRNIVQAVVDKEVSRII